MTVADRDPICEPCGKPITASQDETTCCGMNFHQRRCYEQHVSDAHLAED